MDHHGVTGEIVSRAQRGGSREAIIAAAERLFLEHGFGAVSMESLAKEAGVARRTLYNQFASKEEIFREMLLGISAQLERALPPGIETRGSVEEVLPLIARSVLQILNRPGYVGLVRMVVADSPRFPWVAQAFAAHMEPKMERFARYLAHLHAIGVLSCRNPMLAAHQFTGLLHEFFLWPRVMGQAGPGQRADDVIEEAVAMFLRRYRTTGPGRGR